MKTDLKDFVGEKLSDLQGNIVVLMRKEDHKLNSRVSESELFYF